MATLFQVTTERPRDASPNRICENFDYAGLVDGDWSTSSQGKHIRLVNDISPTPPHHPSPLGRPLMQGQET